MNRQLINIPPAATVEDLRKNLVVALDRILRAIPPTDDAKGKRIQNVGTPAAGSDAVNLRFLQDQVNAVLEEINNPAGPPSLVFPHLFIRSTPSGKSQPYIIFDPNTTRKIELTVPLAASDFTISDNAYYDGTNWQRFDTASAVMQLVTGITNALLIRKAASGSNPISSFTTLATLDSSGKLTLNDGIVAPGDCSLATGASKKVGIGGTASYPLDVTGDINCSGAYRTGGTAGISGSFSPITSLTVNTATLQYKDWSGTNQSQAIVTSVSVNTTVTLSATNGLVTTYA